MCAASRGYLRFTAAGMGRKTTFRAMAPYNKRMQRSLIALITAYQAAVARAVDALKVSGIPQPQSNVEWALNGIPHSGALKTGGTYRKHGYGCTVETSDGEVDFDFG